jgi:hypothetical protein
VPNVPLLSLMMSHPPMGMESGGYVIATLASIQPRPLPWSLEPPMLTRCGGRWLEWDYEEVKDPGKESLPDAAFDLVTINPGLHHYK